MVACLKKDEQASASAELVKSGLRAAGRSGNHRRTTLASEQQFLALTSCRRQRCRLNRVQRDPSFMFPPAGCQPQPHLLLQRR